MNFNNLILAGVLIVLTGCGGSSSSLAPTTQTGVFLDSPVINVGYRTETLEGVTNSLGEYEYIEGETVTFFIGDLEFPPVTATGTVTPLELAGTQDTNNSEVVNIIRLLQTLDQDGDPDNGITITDTAKSSATQVDFGLSEADFAASTAVDALITNAGQDTAVTELVSTSDAIAHFEQELDDNGIAFGSVVGTWINTSTDNDFLMLNFFDDGTYIHAEIDEQAPIDEAGDLSGIEWGTYSQDADTGQLTVTQTFDNNGDTGLTDFVGTPNIFLNVSGDTLTATIDEENDGIIDDTLTFQRQESSDLLGVWTTDLTDNELLGFVFFADGTYVHFEIDEEAPFDEVGDMSGMEWGTYSRDANTGQMTVTQIFDNNGDTGLTDFVGTPNIFLNVSGDTLTATIDEEDDGIIDDTIAFQRR